jgi:phosphatidylethanolamine/phosphatidyl-N-methylethanolamine N-methyltransferase
MSRSAINTAAWNRARYSIYAPLYDTLAAPFQGGRRRAVELLGLQAGERVLVLGCGTGLDLPLLPAGLAVSAINLTPAMVRRTAARAARLEQRVGASVMNDERLVFPDASFDAVLLHLILAVIPDPVACAREAARVLRPGGRVSIFDKFLPDNAQPSPLRRAANVVTGTLFSEINRQLRPILGAAGLVVQQTEPAGLGGTYQIAIATKEG